jgi:hypothetical protein
MEAMREWLAVGGATTLLAVCAVAGTVKLDQAYPLRLAGTTTRFNPTVDADLRRLESQVEECLATADDESKHSRRGLEEIERLAGAALACSNAPERESLEIDLVETASAVNNNERPTVPRHFDAIMTPEALLQFYRPIGVGEKPATDLQPGSSDDLSRLDPLPSSFWARPKDIATEDLSNGFGRKSPPRIEGKIWRYMAPKETTGMNPGFEAECDGQRVKLKFGEVSSEPLVTRMFWALGFHADPTDYASGVKLAYDRRIFTEFNSRLPVRTTFTAFWIVPVYKMNLQHDKDPFNYVAKAVLRDGSAWSGAELKRRLMSGTNFLPAVEAQLDYILTGPANAQVKDPQIKSIGPWDYGQLDHAGRREVRGAGLLAAWLGFYDTRFDNTKLRRVGSKKHPQLLHYFSDLGGGLGETTGLISWHGENVNAFPWTFTAPPLDQGKGRLARPLRIVGYTPVVRTAAFAAMTIDDARWMARLIGQLRVAQIAQALAASGYDAATARLYTQKLISRRNKMMADFGLGDEFPPLRAPK